MLAELVVPLTGGRDLANEGLKPPSPDDRLRRGEGRDREKQPGHARDPASHQLPSTGPMAYRRAAAGSFFARSLVYTAGTTLPVRLRVTGQLDNKIENRPQRFAG